MYRKSFLLVSIFGCLFSSSAFSQTAVLKAARTPIYNRPDPRGKIIAQLARGDTIHVLKKQGLWVRLKFRRKYSGWMYLGQPRDRNPRVRRRKLPDNPPRHLSQLGISFHLGALGKDFTYAGKFFYASFPNVYMEGTFQHVPGAAANSYLMYGNLKYLWPLSPAITGWLTLGVGVITTVPTKTVAAKSISNMSLNYGLGIQKYLKTNTYLRIDLRQYAALVDSGVTTFWELMAGFAVFIR